MTDSFESPQCAYVKQTRTRQTGQVSTDKMHKLQHPSPGPAPSFMSDDKIRMAHTKTLERDLEIALICQRQQRQIYNKGRCRYGRRRAVFLRQFDV